MAINQERTSVEKAEKKPIKTRDAISPSSERDGTGFEYSRRIFYLIVLLTSISGVWAISAILPQRLLPGEAPMPKSKPHEDWSEYLFSVVDPEGTVELTWDYQDVFPGIQPNQAYGALYAYDQRVLTYSVFIDPEGKKWVSEKGDHLVVFRADDGSLKRIPGSFENLGTSYDEQYVLLLKDETTYGYISLVNDDETFFELGSRDEIFSPYWTNSGYLLVKDPEKCVIIDSATNTVVQEFMYGDFTDNHYILDIHYTHEGELFLYVVKEDTDAHEHWLMRYDSETGEMVDVFTAVDPSFSPDSRYLLYSEMPRLAEGEEAIDDMMYRADRRAYDQEEQLRHYLFDRQTGKTEVLYTAPLDGDDRPTEWFEAERVWFRDSRTGETTIFENLEEFRAYLELNPFSQNSLK